MRVKFPLQVGQGEAANVEYSLNLLRGLPLYPNPEQGPYLYVAYPPLYPWLQSFLLVFIHNPWLPGRLLAFSGYVGCGLLIFLWGKKRWGLPLALLLSGFFGIFPTWALWGTMDRCDTFFLLVYFSAFLLLLKDELQNSRDAREEGRPGAAIAWAGVLSALAILTKQNGFELWVVYGIFCLTGGRWKKFAFFILFSLPWVAAVYGWEQWRSGGFFFKNAFLWLDTGLRLDNFTYFLLHPFLREGWALVAVLTFLLTQKNFNRLLQWQFLFSIISLFSLARTTSAENYFLEFFLFGIFLAGEGLAASDRVTGSKKSGLIKFTWPAWVYFAFFVLLFASLNYMRWPNLPTASMINMKYECAAEIYNRSGEHLALDLDLPLMAGKRIWIQPAEYTAMVEKGIWSPEPLLRDIRGKKYSTIELYDIPRQYLLPQVVVDEIGRSYRVYLTAFGRKWYIPK